MAGLYHYFGLFLRNPDRTHRRLHPQITGPMPIIRNGKISFFHGSKYPATESGQINEEIMASLIRPDSKDIFRAISELGDSVFSCLESILGTKKIAKIITTNTKIS